MDAVSCQLSVAAKQAFKHALEEHCSNLHDPRPHPSKTEQGKGKGKGKAKEAVRPQPRDKGREEMENDSENDADEDNTDDDEPSKRSRRKGPRGDATNICHVCEQCRQFASLILVSQNLLRQYLHHKGFKTGAIVDPPMQQVISAFEVDGEGGPDLSKPRFDWFKPFSSQWNDSLLFKLATEFQDQSLSKIPHPEEWDKVSLLKSTIRRKMERFRTSYKNSRLPPPGSTHTHEEWQAALCVRSRATSKKKRRDTRRVGVHPSSLIFVLYLNDYNRLIIDGVRLLKKGIPKIQISGNKSEKYTKLLGNKG